ncbi:uncharacterized protein A1O9_08773 [Exophiala aquamarina CBS 119918]|uniref:RING-type domain-containing protein n=1 Tax=Exophiala aquamarina CBS 119918 TaxID=1182545 RepID=A0A072PHV9_9EURO|nr:uncharacterized protein A1O9_08773 [Exophiala aquamarina CBS 119918]KEF55120.1 hypothetical protein A1O9_08773 [Exophiala aquamarina CBS 119918]
MLTVKQLCRDLGIKHPDKHSTCIGYGKAKPTCGNAVAAASRSTAVSILQDICYGIEDGLTVRDLSSDLNAAACLLHCKRWHQGQGPAMSQEWERKLPYWERNLRYSTAQGFDEGHQQTRRRQQRQTSSQTVERGSGRQTSRRPTSRSAEPVRELSQCESDLLVIQMQNAQLLNSMRLMQSMLDQYQRNEQRLRLPLLALAPSHTSSRSRIYADDEEDDRNSDLESDFGSDSGSDVSDWQDSTTPSRASAASTASRSNVARSLPSSNRVVHSPQRGTSSRSSQSSLRRSTTSSSSSATAARASPPVSPSSSSRSASSRSEQHSQQRGSPSRSSHSSSRRSNSSSSPVPASRTRLALSAPFEQSTQQRRSPSRTSSRRSTDSESLATPAPSSVSSSSSSGDLDDCGVCLEPLPSSGGSRSHRGGGQGDNNDIWTCEACHNSAHIECFDMWVTHSSEDNVRCIYCRGAITI